MLERVTSVTLHNLVKAYAIVCGNGCDLLWSAAQTKQTIVELSNVVAQILALVAFRIDRNEDRLHAFWLGSDLPQGVDHFLEVRRAKVGTVRIPEVDQHPLTLEVGTADDFSGRVGQ